MTLTELKALFNQHDKAEWGHFERVENPRNPRPDLHALLMLDALFPYDPGDPKGMVTAVSSETVWLSPETDALLAVLTEAHVIELLRCRVWLVDHQNTLAIIL